VEVTNVQVHYILVTRLR